MSSGASAGFAPRLAALLYDSILLTALFIAYTSAAMLLNHRTALEFVTAGAWVYAYRAGLVALVAGYYLLNWTRSGQTLGMRAWHLRAVTDAGRRMGVKTAALRFLCGILAWPPAMLGVLWLYADSQHLALHDRLSKTRVIRLEENSR